MNIDLVKKLVEVGVIRENTEIQALYFGTDLAGTNTTPCRDCFLVRNVRISSSTIFFDTVSTIDGSPKTIKSPQIELIDGMPLERLASIYGINAKGGTVPQGKRRGRKPREKIVESFDEDELDELEEIL